MGKSENKEEGWKQKENNRKRSQEVYQNRKIQLQLLQDEVKELLEKAERYKKRVKELEKIIEEMTDDPCLVNQFSIKLWHAKWGRNCKRQKWRI